jgi:hypothetical protein
MNAITVPQTAGARTPTIQKPGAQEALHRRHGESGDDAGKHEILDLLDDLVALLIVKGQKAAQHADDRRRVT